MLISVILPTYNRAAFLPQALESIRAQAWTNWELIVVDDGSTDDTEAVLKRHVQGWPQPVRYIRQDNRGPYGARSTGLAHASGECVAFFDSDDKWLPEYVAECVAAMSAYPEVDWVYVACTMAELVTGRVITPNTFYVDGVPRPFLRLDHRVAGPLRVFSDKNTLACAATSGLYCGFQNSLIRRRVFAAYREPIFPARVGEDVMTAIRAIAHGFELAYIDRALVIYNVHDGNLSAVSTDSSTTKRLESNREFARALAALSEELRGHTVAHRILRKAAAECYFWRVGYSVLWRTGRRREALSAYNRAMKLWPWNLRRSKTYLLALLRLTGRN